ncbi:MAG TPA: Zn-dependent alcohol dehydrogenase [Acidimicrobiales bacterium]|jgi:S-(hydroxymethyl)glutathione dehydrogenase/alcohol dehydrogenase
MRAIVYSGPNEIALRDDVSFKDPLGSGQVRVQIVNAGLCHSDVSLIDGTIPYPTPAVMGHEGAGVVTEVGSEVTHVEAGDHVVLTTLTSCGLCPACADGRPVLCKKSNRLARTLVVGEDEAYNFANCSVWAEEAVVNAVQAVNIPRDVPFTTACLVGCGVLTGVGAVLNRAQVRPGDAVAVIGVGGIGLSVVQGARLSNASRIVAIDTNPAKEEIARRFGATDFVNPADLPDGTDVVAAVRALDGLGDGVDHAFECVGAPALIRNAVDLLDWGGQAVLLGVPKLGTEALFVVQSLYHDKSILGCRYGSSSPQRDIPLLIEMYREGKLLLDELVTSTYALADIGTALSELADGKLARGVLEVTPAP